MVRRRGFIHVAIIPKTAEMTDTYLVLILWFHIGVCYKREAAVHTSRFNN